MKQVLTLVAFVAALFTMASCDNRPNPAGEWSGRVSEDMPGVQWTMDLTLNFSQDGHVGAEYVICSVEDLHGNDSILSPFEARITASVTMDGVWQYVDGEDDEILVKFDKNSIDVNIAPDEIEYLVDELTDQETAETRQLSEAAIDSYKKSLKFDFASNNSTFILEDVRVRGNELKFEVDNAYYLLTAVGAK